MNAGVLTVRNLLDAQIILYFFWRKPVVDRLLSVVIKDKAKILEQMNLGRAKAHRSPIAVV